MDFPTERAIPDVFLFRMADIQLLLVLYIHDRLNLNPNQAKTMDYLFNKFCTNSVILGDLEACCHTLLKLKK